MLASDTQQYGIFIEELAPFIGSFVAYKYHRVRTFFILKRCKALNN